MALRLLVCMLAWTSLAWSASFDQPVFKKTVDLGPSRSGSGTRARVTCYFFPHFMVKEVDMGEKGAERLAIVPVGKSKTHTCSRLRDEGEKAIDSDEWTGYFKGVKEDLVFFDADDGVNGGTGFAVFNAKTGKKVFEDSALGPLEFVNSQEKSISVRYTRVVEGGCVVPKDQGACWETIKKKLGLDGASAPDCKNGYEKSAQALAQGRCQAQKAGDSQCLAKELPLARTQSGDSPSVIAYPVELVLDANPVLRPVGGEVRCWPAD